MCRRKRLSHEDEDLPTASSAAGFVFSHHKPLLATFVVAWVWFARVVAPLAVSVAPSAPRTEMQRDVGLFLATGSVSLAAGLAEVSSAGAALPSSSPVKAARVAAHDLSLIHI